MKPGAFINQIQFETSDDPKRQKRLKRRHRRVTFLVNIWLNYQPFNVHPFPDTMVDKLSGYKEKRIGLEFQSSDSSPTKDISTSSTEVKDRKSSSTLDDKPKKFTWPMGDCHSTETITVSMPLSTIRDAASGGGNVNIEWDQEKEACFSLQRGSTTEAIKRTKEDESNEGTKRARTE